MTETIDTTALAGVLFFTDRGRAYRATVHELPKEKLSAAQNLFQFVQAGFPITGPSPYTIEARDLGVPATVVL